MSIGNPDSFSLQRRIATPSGEGQGKKRKQSNQKGQYPLDIDFIHGYTFP